MMILLATREVRRTPALLLVACLLTMSGALVTSAPVRDAATDGMRAYAATHVQLLRAPALRGAPTGGGGHMPVAFLAAGSVVPRASVVSEPTDSRAPVVLPRTAPRLSPLSRAPPATA